MQEMNGQIALVTGAGRGIGSAIAKSLAKEGATVIVNYAGNAQAAQDTVDSILKNGGSAEKYQCDVSDFAAVEEMIKYVVQKYEKIDILVNNAGITKDGLLLRMSEQDFKQVLAVNLGGTFHCIRHAAKYDKAEKRQDYQSGIGCRSDRKCRTGKLRGIQSRCYRAYKICGKRTGIQTDYSQCDCTGVY